MADVAPPTLGQIRLYPVKSLDPVVVDQAEVSHFSLKYDRQWALVDEDGAVLNGKRTGRVNELKAEFDLSALTVSLGERAHFQPRTFHLEKDQGALEASLSSFFGQKVHLVRDERGGLLDIPVQSSVTVVARATLQHLAEGIPGETLETIRRRFRANLELEGVPAYWEEQLVGAKGQGRHFTLGAVKLVGVGIRARCNVPPRDPWTGQLNKRFVRQMLTLREGSVPPWSHVRALGSLYHLTIDTLLAPESVGLPLRSGDVLRLQGLVNLPRADQDE